MPSVPRVVTIQLFSGMLNRVQSFTIKLTFSVLSAQVSVLQNSDPTWRSSILHPWITMSLLTTMLHTVWVGHQ